MAFYNKEDSGLYLFDCVSILSQTWAKGTYLNRAGNYIIVLHPSHPSSPPNCLLQILLFPHIVKASMDFVPLKLPLENLESGVHSTNDPKSKLRLKQGDPLLNSAPSSTT